VTPPLAERAPDQALPTGSRLADRLKPVGAAIAWVSACVGLGIGITLILERIIPSTDSPWWLARAGAIQATGFGIATWLVGKRWNQRSWADMGWRSMTGAPGAFALGALWGGAMAVLAVLLAVLLSGARIYFHAPGPVFPVGGPILVGVLFAALSEELLFRGYPLRRIADALGPGRAMIVSAVAFGAAHLMNPEAAVLGAINVALAGAWLALAFFSPGGMALAWGVHVGWNATLAELFHAPVSGYDFAIPGAHYSPGRYEFVDGGLFGPEGGLVGTIAIATGVAMFWRRARQASIA